jgi:hypothetical protein
MRLVGPYLDGGSSYCQSPLGDVVWSMLRGAGMASDRTEGIVLVGVSVACLPLSEQVCPAGLDLYLFLPGVGMAERS